MTDLERAADLIGHCIPIGFSSSEDNEKCQRIIDSLAVEILALSQKEEPDPREVPEGIVAILRRFVVIESHAVKGLDHDDRGDDTLFQRIKRMALHTWIGDK